MPTDFPPDAVQSQSAPTAAEAQAPRSTRAQEEAPFNTEQVFTVALGHTIHDSFSAFVAPLLPLIQERLQTSYTATGSLTIFLQLPSLLNPFIGYLADRVSLRYFIILAPAITATLCSALGLVSSYLALALLLFTAGLSVAAFHAPAPAMIGRLSGRNVGTGMSIFMAAGELGRTIGPLLVASGVSWWGLPGLWRLAVIGWICSVILFFRLRHIPARPGETQLPIAEALPRLRRVFPIISWIVVMKALLVVSITTYLPIYMDDVRAANFWLASAALTVLEGAGVVGALMTGTFSDRIGRKRMLYILLTLSPLMLFLFLAAPDRALFFLLIALGLTAISPTPVVLALVQDYFPDLRALANGTLLTVNFLSRVAAVWIVGQFADRLGLQTAFLISGAVSILSVLGVFLLPEPAQLLEEE